MIPRRCGRQTLVLIILAFIIAIPACGDYVALQNEYIGVAIGRGGNWTGPYAHTLISSDPPMGGRFQIWTIKGDPTVDTDYGWALNYCPAYPPMPGDKWGAWQVMVDSWTDDDEYEHVWTRFEDEGGGTSGIWGDSAAGSWELMPYVPTNENVIRAVWYPSPSGGTSLKRGDVDVLRPVIRCELDCRLVRDTVRFKWTLKNESSRYHSVGLRVYADLLPNPEDSGTQDLRNIVVIPGHPLLLNRTLLMGKEIPPVIEMFDSREDPAMSIRLIFEGQSATKPDVVGIDEWPTVAGANWTYHQVAPGQAPDPFTAWSYSPLPYTFISDIGYGAFWKPRRLAPGQSMTIIHYIGLACATSDYTKPNIENPQYVAAVQGPRCLGYYKPAGESLESTGYISPDPFTIRAYIQNTQKYLDLTNATFTLMLPSCLMLDESENNKYTKTLSRISADSEGSVSWLVRPVGTPTGIQRYSVSFSADPVGGTTVTREINVPATEVQPLSSGWQMVSVPFKLENPDPDTALGLFPGFQLYKYDTYLARYVAVDVLEPGVAYWLRLPFPQTTSFTTGSMPINWAGTQGYWINLQRGWNMIGNPYVYTVTMGELRFYTREYGTLDYDQAIQRGLISSTVFWWDPVFRKYQWSSQRSVQLKPWQGYWFRVLKPGVAMIFTPITQIGAKLGGVPIEGR